jgi:hypothetical protein
MQDGAHFTATQLVRAGICFCVHPVQQGKAKDFCLMDNSPLIYHFDVAEF